MKPPARLLPPLVLVLLAPLLDAGEAAHQIRELTDRYLELAPRASEGREPLASLREELLRDVPADDLTMDERIDRRLLRALLDRDLYDFDGPEVEGAPPPEGFLWAMRRQASRAPEERGRLMLEAVRGTARLDPDALERSDARARGRAFRRFLEQSLPTIARHLPSLREDLESAAETGLGRLDAWLERVNERPAGGAGRRRFEHLVQRFHLVPLDADQLLEIARAVRAQTLAELERVADRIEPGAGWRAVAASLQEDRFADPDDYFAGSKAALKDALRFVEEHDLVTLPEGAFELEARRVRPDAQHAYGYYLQPPPGSRRGAYGVPADHRQLTDEESEALLRDNHRHWTRVVALHEGVPGHHLQFTRAREQQSRVRKVFYTPVFSEGWALYCEEMMWRHGYFDDPRTRLAQLQMRLWRAVRVILDVSLNCHGMGEREAVDFLSDEVGLAREGASREVRRYVQSPTQPFSYLIGFLQIEALRDELMRREGARFDEKAFHDRLLSFGSIPLALIREAMQG